MHQAKGLEFPVVVIWDGRGIWDSRGQGSPWRMSRDGRGWLMELDDLGWEEPAGGALRATEQQYRQSERRRVVYVAATRARDLALQGSINPNLADFGTAPETRQYSGRKVEAGWKCPFHLVTAQPNNKQGAPRD